RTAGDAAGRHRHEAEQAVAGHGLARTGLPDDGQGLARLHVEADPVHRLHEAVAGVEVHLKIANLQQGHGQPQSVERRGSSASRKPSPRKSSANSVSVSARPGKISSHGYSSMVSTP